MLEKLHTIIWKDLNRYRELFLGLHGFLRQIEHFLVNCVEHQILIEPSPSGTLWFSFYCQTLRLITT